MSTELSVLLAVGCVILGVVGTYGFTFFHECRKEQAASKQLAAILCIEMLQQAEYIVQCCTVVNRAFLSEPKELLREEDIRRYLPPPPGVYTSSLEKFGLLPNHVSSQVIKFYNELQKARIRPFGVRERSSWWIARMIFQKVPSSGSIMRRWPGELTDRPICMIGQAIGEA